MDFPRLKSVLLSWVHLIGNRLQLFQGIPRCGGLFSFLNSSIRWARGICFWFFRPSVCPCMHAFRKPWVPRLPSTFIFIIIIIIFIYSHQELLQPFNGLFSRTTWVSPYQKGKTNLDFTGARDSEWQWHQLGHVQVCTSLQTDNHASTPPLCFLQAGCPSCRPTNSVKALKARNAYKINTRINVVCRQ